MDDSGDGGLAIKICLLAVTVAHERLSTSIDDMAQTRRRVSYVIPPPNESVPRLQLPPHGAIRLGSTGPLLTPSNQRTEVREPSRARHPRHRLGVASLALDTSTTLLGRNSPEGILYSGGRDGLIISWDLGISTKKRKATKPTRNGRWEVLTGWADNFIDEEGEDDERVASDGDVLGEVIAKRRRASSVGKTSYEQQWETDLTLFEPGTHSQFRQCAQAHSDWVNDMLLCNYNQTVVSASSDGTVKAWNPHSITPSDPSTVGLHNDYVRCLAYCRDQNWVASGSFDRTIKLWDLSRTGPAAASDPLLTLNSADSAVPKSSVYSLAADPFGRTIASGSPERVVRLWDPRNGKRTGKLVGHTDNIRAILLSEDSKYLLTSSADASIKLWSLSSQRCLHTFTHHTESVWSLFSTHPSLETFYSGDRSGLACRVDIEGCSHLSEGECILLSNNSGDSTRPSTEAINKIVVMDDNLLWTASGTSSIKRWHIPQRRVTRVSSSKPFTDTDGDRIPIPQSPTLRRLAPKGDLTPERSIGHVKPRRMSSVPSFRSASSLQTPDRYPDTKLNGIPFESLVKLSSPNDPFTPFTSNRTRDPEVATLYSAASIMSVHAVNRPSAQSAFAQSHASPLHTSRTDETMLPANMARADYEERDIAADAVPVSARPDDVLHGDRGLVRSIILSDKVHALTVDTAGEVAVWDIVRATCLGRFSPEEVAAASQSGSLSGENDEQERSPREALEAVRERIEGEAVISTWCSADTKTGVLTIHLTERCFDAEVYADEVGFARDRHFDDESKLNLGKWVLRNLFIGFIREEQQSRQNSSANNSAEGSTGPSLSRSSSSHKPSHSSDSPRRRPARKASSSIVTCSSKMIPAIIPTTPTAVRSSPLLTPLIPLHLIKEPLTVMSAIPQSPGGSDTTPTPGFHQRSRSGNADLSSSKTPLSSTMKDDYFGARARQQSMQGGAASPADEFSAWGAAGKTEPQTPSTPGGIMGRLKNFGGKITKRPVSDIASPLVATPSEVLPSPEETTLEIQPSPVQILLAKPLAPPATIDGPLHSLPQKTILFIEEEASPSYMTVYRGTVLQTHQDVQVLEEAMPMWLIKFLLFNEIPIPTPQVKLSFVLLPWNKDPDVEPLPELLNTTQSKLTANRNLRVSKLIQHIQDKLDPVPGSGSRPSSDDHSQPLRPKAEDLYEIFCNDALLPLDMTLAAVRQYVWRQSAELVMHYRRKQRHSPI